MQERHLFNWFLIKQNLNNRKPIFIKEGEIYWCYIGINVGNEQNGGKNFQRPVLIIKKFTKNFILVIPITKNLYHKGNWYIDIFIKKIKHKLILNQVRTKILED